MKSFIPWCCLIAATNIQVAFANEGFDAYRQGHYEKAVTHLEANRKDAYADYYLGRMRLYGYGLLKDNTLAMRYFKQAAEKGFLPAQNIMARYALLQENDAEKALYWFKKAADQDDVQAQMYCAAVYQYGFGTKKSAHKARKYFIDAAKNGNRIAQYTLAEYFLKSRYSKDRNLGVIWLKKSVEQDNPAAQLKLGVLYTQGKEIKKDLEKAQEYMQLAADQKYLPAMVALGDLAREHKKPEDAKIWYSKAANQGDASAQIALAELYLQKDNAFYSPQKGFLWLLKAAQSNDSDAQRALAKLYDEGRYLAKNEHLAKAWLKKAQDNKETKQSSRIKTAEWLSNGQATQFIDADYQLKGIFTAWNNPNALKENNYNLAPQMDEVTRSMLFTPDFVMTDPKKIPINEYYNALIASMDRIQHYEIAFPTYAIQRRATLEPDAPLVAKSAAIAVDEKSASLRPEPSRAILDSMDLKEDPDKQTLFERLYNQAIYGNPNAQFKLGQLFQNGIGVEKNTEKALHFYMLAAEQNSLPAEYNLGLLYLKGEGIKPDYKEALKWLREAAFEGNAYAQYALARINEQGYRDEDGKEVIKPNEDRALAMYYLASSNEHGPSQYRLAEILVRQKPIDLSVSNIAKRNQLIKRLYEGAVAEGVKEASLPLAFFNAAAQDPKKQAQALAVAQEEVGEGNAQAALLLGMMYDRGIAVDANQAKAIYWYQQASENPVSTFVLGTYYSEGKGINQDVKKGESLLQKSADGGFSYANLNLAVMQRQQGKPFLPMLDKAHALGNPTASSLLADYYLSDLSDESKMKQARGIYEKLAEKGDKKAQLKLGFMYQQGFGGSEDREKAKYWYTLAAKQEQDRAKYLLGHLHQMGWLDGRPDYDKAKEWYESIKKTHPAGAIALGFIHETVDDDYKRATEAYQLAAEQGDANGQYNLGLIYEKGKGVPMDFDKAQALYFKAADQGHAQAMVQLAGLYFNGQDGPRNEQQALYWYKKAADLGDREALYQLGLMSETGVGTKLNFPYARNYYQKAAAKGNAKAMLALARMYQYGLGVRQDKQKAAGLYQILVEQNNSYAQYQLATLYYEGINGKSMTKEGKKLLEQAQTNGNKQASRVLQWMDAQSEQHLSFIEPALMGPSNWPGKSADLLYLDAMNEWNRGDEQISRMILNRIRMEFPHYIPAKRAYEQLHQPFSLRIFG